MLANRLFDEPSKHYLGVDQAKPESEDVMGMLNLRSPNLGAPPGHSDRVALYALAIGKHLDLCETELRALRRAAVLHDIGKIGISPQIVNKLGQLTEREFEIMRLHTTIAIRMLERVADLQDSIPMIKHHHERYDGKGYPDGLKGHEIPLGARIIAVAETFDVLVSDVPWRDAISLKEALNEIEANSGTQFDPMIVEAFLTVIRQRKVELPQNLAEELCQIEHPPAH